MVSNTEQSNPAPNRTRWGWVKFGIGICAIMLPILIFSRTNRESGDQSNAMEHTALSEKQFGFIDANYLSLDDLKARFEPISKVVLASCTNVQRNVDETERRLCRSDPHLAAALKDPKQTPFANPNPKTTVDLNLDRDKLADILIDDYLENTNDLPERGELLVPIMRLTMVQGWTGKPTTELAKLREFEQVNADPLLYYCIARASDTDEVFLEACEKGAKALTDRPTNPFLHLLMSVNRLQKFGTLSPEALSKELILSVNVVGDAVQHYADNEFMLLAIYPRIQSLLNQYNGYARIELARELYQQKNPSCPEWILQAVCSSVNQFIASEYRGGTYISEVPPDKLMKFEKFSTNQATHLLRAWALQPNAISFLPLLIKLETRAGTTGRPTETWLRHSLALRLDYSDTVDAYTYACEPRWGGSLEQFLWFSEKCSECLDVESELGFLAWYPLYQWCVERGFAGNLSEPTAARIAVKMIDFLKTNRDNLPHPKVLGKRSAMITRILWDAGRLAELYWFLTRYSDSFTSEDLSEFLLDKKLVMQVSEAANEDGLACWSIIHSELLVNSIRLNNERLAIVRLALEDADLLHEVDQRTVFKELLETCWRLFNWAEQFHSGQTVRLGFEGDGLGWLKSTQYRILDEQSIEMRSQVDESKDRIMPMLRFPPPYAIEAEFEATQESMDYYGVAIQAGAFGHRCSVGVGVEIRFMPAMSRVAMDRLPDNYRSGQDYRAARVAFPTTNKLRLELRDRQAKGFLGNQAFPDFIADFETFGLVGIGRPSASRIKDTFGGHVTYRISNVRIERLETE